jgi:hypothetical protein
MEAVEDINASIAITSKTETALVEDLSATLGENVFQKEEE